MRLLSRDSAFCAISGLDYLDYQLSIDMEVAGVGQIDYISVSLFCCLNSSVFYL